MRIEICGNTVSGLSSELNSLERSLNTAISKLQTTQKSVNQIKNGPNYNTNNASASLGKSIEKKKQTLEDVKAFKGKVQAFSDNAISIDKSVANRIKINDKALKNELKGSSFGGNGILDGIGKFLSDTWESIKDFVSKSWEHVKEFLADAVEWLEENWKTLVKVVEAVVAIVGVVAAFVFGGWVVGLVTLGGMALIALIDWIAGDTIWKHIIKIGLGIIFCVGAILIGVESIAAFAIALVGAIVIGAALGAFNAWLDGNNILSGAIDGAEDGFLMAGLLSFVNSLLTRLSKLKFTQLEKDPPNTWNMNPEGDTINGRYYTKHALERMAYDTPEVRAELELRAYEIATAKGMKTGTPEYSEFFKSYVDPRGIPPFVVEEVINNSPKIPSRPGTFSHILGDIEVILNGNGDVVTVKRI